MTRQIPVCAGTEPRVEKRNVGEVRSSDATMISQCWPRWIRPLIRSMSHEKIGFSLAGWQITDMESPFFKLPTVLKRVCRPDKHWNPLRLFGLAVPLTTVNC